MGEEFNNIDTLIQNMDISKRDLHKFLAILKNYQPNNTSLIFLLEQHKERNLDRKTLDIFDKTVEALFQSLDYPTDDITITDPDRLIGYSYIKDCIIEYCITNIKSIPTIIDNVAFLNNKTKMEVRKKMDLYMSSYGNTMKTMAAFMQYSDNYKANIQRSTLPEGYIPVFSRAVALKISEMKNNKKK